MAIYTASILGFLLTIMGLLFKANWLVAVGALIFLLTGGIVFLIGLHIPLVVYILAILLILYLVMKK